MSSAVWSIATMKKSILFDVLAVIDRVNKAKNPKTILFDYSLLKQKTVERYNKIYIAAIDQSEDLAAILYVPVKKPKEERFTVIYEYFIDLAFDMCSFEELIRYINQADRNDFAYCIVAKCLSTPKREVTRDEIAELVNINDRKVIDFLFMFSIPEKVKMSIYTMIYYYDDFIESLIQYLKKVYKKISDLYEDLYCVFHDVESMLVERLQDKQQRYQLISLIGRRVKSEDDFLRKQIIILSLVRLEYCWMKVETKYNFYLVGLFFVQRIIHDDEFELF